MAEQCIVCLENLDTAVPAQEGSGGGTNTAPLPPGDNHDSAHVDDKIAVIQVCGHTLHDFCLREWTVKANSCPICRKIYHDISVFDKVGGTLLSTYEVEDKKQVAEFDPQTWLDENPEAQEETTPCPICGTAGDENVLLLCDGCDAPYHTHCIGLEDVPQGAWFCMECADVLGSEIHNSAQGSGRQRNNFFPRTQAGMRRDRNRARTDNWMGAWGQVSSRILDFTDIDVDSHDDDALEEFRRSQQLRENELRERRRWEQRLSIASRLGARDVFARNIQGVVGQQIPARATPTPPRETREERRAWGALDRARDIDVDVLSPGRRKRKSRSISASPVEPAPEPERRLKRPRTRRLALQSEPGPSKPASTSTSSHQTERQGEPSNAGSPPPDAVGPSFLSTLLREVEMTPHSDDENVRSLFAPPPPVEASSPVLSPATSTHNSPRSLSLTPPPNPTGRSTSPVLSLSSRIEPLYPRANFSPSRSNGETSDSEQRPQSPELKQPRPQRPQQPVRFTSLPLNVKEVIQQIVRSTLKPYWISGKLTSEQFSSTNRSICHKLYEQVSDPAIVDDDAKKAWEKLAAKEVADAVPSVK